MRSVKKWRKLNGKAGSRTLSPITCLCLVTGYRQLLTLPLIRCSKPTPLPDAKFDFEGYRGQHKASAAVFSIPISGYCSTHRVTKDACIYSVSILHPLLICGTTSVNSSITPVYIAGPDSEREY